MVLPSLLAISAFDKESRGEPLTKAELDAKVAFWMACQRFMETFRKFVEKHPGAQCKASVSRPAKTEEPA